MPRKRTADPKTTTEKVGDSAKRTARTGVQGAAAVAVIVQGINLFAPRPLTPEQAAWATVAATMLVSLLMNLIEEASGHAFLKGSEPPPPVDDLTRRELNALAAAIGGLHIELRDLKADRPSMSGFNVPANDREPIATHTPGAP